MQPLGTDVSAFINILTINVLAFTSNLGLTTSQKCSNLALKFFLTLTPSVKRALEYVQYMSNSVVTGVRV